MTTDNASHGTTLVVVLVPTRPFSASKDRPVGAYVVPRRLDPDDMARVLLRLPADLAENPEKFFQSDGRGDLHNAAVADSSLISKDSERWTIAFLQGGYVRVQRRPGEDVEPDISITGHCREAAADYLRGAKRLKSGVSAETAEAALQSCLTAVDAALTALYEARKVLDSVADESRRRVNLPPTAASQTRRPPPF